MGRIFGDIGQKKVTKPTRNVRVDQQANIVDLVLKLVINDCEIIPKIVHCAPIGKSDHDVLIFQIIIPKEKKT